MQSHGPEFEAMSFGEYVEWHQKRPAPFTLTAAQAEAQWKRDLDNPEVDSQKIPVFNPQTKRQELLDHIWVQASWPSPEPFKRWLTSWRVRCGTLALPASSV